MDMGQGRGFVLRPPAEDDAQAVADLIVACDIADIGVADYSLDELRSSWRKPNFAPRDDARVVETPAGRIVGYAEVWDHGHVRFDAFGSVHPDHRGRGIGTALVHWTEARARGRLDLAPPGDRVTLGHGISGNDGAAARLLEGEGFARVRTFLNMLIRMDAPPAPPEWPEGIVARPLALGRDDRALHAATEEAFRDHWGSMPVPFEEWRDSRLGYEGFDPSLVCVAWDGDEIAGAIRCRYRGENGWVDNLSVRRPWRGRGLGMALLRQAFGAFYRRGAREVGLGVDAESPTGATRLYERAGMHVYRRFDVYHKTLREGAG